LHQPSEYVTKHIHIKIRQMNVCWKQ